MQNLTIISSNYPSKSRPFYGTFVQQLVRAIARTGVKCSVISPMSIFDLRYGRFDPRISFDFSTKENPIKVLRPRYISFSEKKLLNYNSVYLTQKCYEKTVCRTLSCIDYSPWILYGHFLYPSGAAAVHIASSLGIPSIVAVGEGTFWGVESIGYKKAIQDFSHVTGVLSVSSLLKQNLVTKLKIPEEKIIVIPNGVNLRQFYPRSKAYVRKKFGLPAEKFIIAFTGHFDENKGPHRLLEAALGLENIGLVFIGEGNIPLESNNILFKGLLEHSQVPEMLSASDIFVLPTILEGSCNAIIEALACGLPVVTSKGKFNDDIVDDAVAIRIDPQNINDIRKAIQFLYNNDNLRRQMSIAALIKIKHYDINVRASKIIEWLKTIKFNHLSNKKSNH